MNPSFLSVVAVIHEQEDLLGLSQKLDQLGKTLSNNFKDFEIILINNLIGTLPDAEIEPLNIETRKNIHLINLSSRSNKNYAILAGLDRANGDYSIILEFQFLEKTEWINELFQKTQEGFDLVYLRAAQPVHYGSSNIMRGIFYGILRNYSDLKIDPLAHDTRIISRRALNSLLRLRENLRYMKPIYSIIGYRSTFLQTETELKNIKESFSDQFKTSLVAITSFTSFLSSVALWIFLSSIVMVIAVIFNAFKVKYTNYDLFGTYHEALSGWAFTVVIISIFFSITSLNLYIVSIYLSNIYQEIKKRPLYIIESIRRF